MSSGYQLFDHTADMGLRVWAADLPGLIAPATEALYAAIGELHVRADESRPTRIRLEGGDPAALLRDYLAELLLRFECEKRIVVDFERIAFDERHLDVAAAEAPLDEKRCRFAREVKAVTYHDLGIRRTDEGVEATVIIDI